MSGEDELFPDFEDVSGEESDRTLSPAEEEEEEDDDDDEGEDEGEDEDDDDEYKDKNDEAAGGGRAADALLSLASAAGGSVLASVPEEIEEEEEAKDEEAKGGDDKADKDEADLPLHTTYTSNGKHPVWSAYGECGPLEVDGDECPFHFALEAVQHKTWESPLRRMKKAAFFPNGKNVAKSNVHAHMHTRRYV